MYSHMVGMASLAGWGLQGPKDSGPLGTEPLEVGTQERWKIKPTAPRQSRAPSRTMPAQERTWDSGYNRGSCLNGAQDGCPSGREGLGSRMATSEESHEYGNPGAPVNHCRELRSGSKVPLSRGDAWSTQPTERYCLTNRASPRRGSQAPPHTGTQVASASGGAQPRTALQC